MKYQSAIKSESSRLLTAVQLRDDLQLTCYTVHGHPVEKHQGKNGEIRLFEAGEIVGYVIDKLYNRRAFFFTTAGHNGTHKVPGVFPEVHLLIETRSKGKTRRLLQYIDYARKNRIKLDDMPEDFFIRLNTMLEQRKNSVQDFKKLLARCMS